MELTLICPFNFPFAPGIRSLSSIIKEDGHKVNLMFLPIDFRNIYEKKILDQIANIAQNSSLIGITVMSMYVRTVASLTNYLKKEINIPVVWGGAHPTVSPNESLKYADIVCVSESEISFKALVNKIEKNEEYWGIPGICYKNNNNIFSNPPASLIQNLDQLPFQDVDYKSHYLLADNQINKMDYETAKNFFGSIYLTMASRGCPYSCTYCINDYLKKIHKNENKIRKRSLNNLYNELIEVKQNLPFVKQVWIDDDYFFGSYSVAEIEDFCQIYKKNIGLPLEIDGGTARTLTREKLSLLVAAGLSITRIGIQSGSDRTNKMYRRAQSNEQILEAARLINEFKDKVIINYDIIVDNPWESEEDMIDTLMLLVKLPRPCHIGVRSLTFFPGTTLYHKSKKEGIVVDDEQYLTQKSTGDVTKSYLNRIFLLFDFKSSYSPKIYLWMVKFLVNKKLRKFGISHTLLSILEIRLNIYKVLLLIFKKLRHSVKCSLLNINLL